MRETINRVVNTFATGVGIKAKEYRIEQEGSRSNLRLFVYESNSLIKAEGPYPSEFDWVLNIGRKRFWGRLEWITAHLMWLGGVVGVQSATLDISNPEGVKLLLSIGAIGTGAILAEKGRERKDIATAIINRLSHKSTLSNQSKKP